MPGQVLNVSVESSILKNVPLLTIILRGQESHGMVVSGMLRVIVQQNVS